VHAPQDQKRPGGAFRPRSIEPYRPRGI
jgi:hypothetical protein